MATDNDTIARAVERLNARRADNGMWIYWADETREAFYVTRAELALLGKMLADPYCRDAYSEWCAASGQRPLSKRAVKKYYDR